MIKITASITIALIALGAYSQKITADFGPVLSTVDFSYIPTNFYTEDDFLTTENAPHVFGRPYVGWSGNLGIEYFFKEKYYLSSSVGFLQNGGNTYQAALDYFNSWEDSITRFNFVSVSTIVNYRIIENNKIDFSIGVGPRLDALINYHLPDFYGFSSWNLASNLHRFIFGLTANSGIRYKLDKFFLGIKLNYNFNIISMANYQRTYSSSYPYSKPDDIINIRMRLNYASANFTIGYNFN